MAFSKVLVSRLPEWKKQPSIHSEKEGGIWVASFPSTLLTKSANRVRAFSLGENEKQNDAVEFPSLPWLWCRLLSCAPSASHPRHVLGPSSPPTVFFSRRIFLDCEKKKHARSCLRFVLSSSSHRDSAVDHAIIPKPAFVIIFADMQRASSPIRGV